MFLRLKQQVCAGMGDDCQIRDVVVALGAIDQVDDVSDGSGQGVRITKDNGETLTCLASLEQVCEAIQTLTGGEGLISINPRPAADEPEEI